VDASGAPLASTEIELSGLDGVPLTVQSDAQGHFAFQATEGGHFSVTSPRCGSADSALVRRHGTHGRDGWRPADRRPADGARQEP